MQTCRKPDCIQTVETRSTRLACCFRSPCPPRANGSCCSRTRQRQASVPVQASLRDVVDSFVTYGSISLSLTATAYTIFYDWRNRRDRQAADETLSTNIDDNFTWGVMGVVSCLPLFNFMAWVLGALQSDNPRPYYWAAALYTLPLLRNGFDQDWFSISMLLLGVAHVQALRIAATEPETQAKLQQNLKPLAVIQAVVNTAGTAAKAAIGTGSSSSSSSKQQQLGSSNGRSIEDMLRGNKKPDVQDQEDMLQQLELQEFDRRLQMKSKDKEV